MIVVGLTSACTHIKQQLVCRNKLQGYWFTLHLRPPAPASTYICSVCERVCTHTPRNNTLAVCMNLWIFHERSGFYCCQYYFCHLAGFFPPPPLFSCFSFLVAFFCCLCVCMSVWAIFQTHTQCLMCPAIDLEMTGLLTHTICSAHEERRRGSETVNETFPQSLPIAEYSAAVLSLAPPGGLVQRWQGSTGQVTWREEEPQMRFIVCQLVFLNLLKTAAVSPGFVSQEDAEQPSYYLRSINKHINN